MPFTEGVYLGKPPSGLLRLRFEHNLSKPEGGCPLHTSSLT
jgi:hypothetical protein